MKFLKPSVIGTLLVCAMSLATACGVTPIPEIETVIETTELPVTALKVSVAEFPDALPGREQALEEAIARAASELGEERGMGVEVEIDVRTLAGSVGSNCEGQANFMIPENDLYLLDSPSALHAFQDHELLPVPDDILESIDPFEPSVWAFTDPEGQVLGLAQATDALMVIYNPEVLGELSEQPSWGEMAEWASQYGLAVPAHSCIAIAAFQSAAGEELTEDLIFQGGYQDLVPLCAPIVDQVAQLDNVFAAELQEILTAFIDQAAPLIIHNTGFMAKLAETGYEGPVATTRFPILNHQGGAAHSAGWVVPAASSNPELAWALAEKLTRDPAMLQWGLANGMAPMNQAGFDTLLQDPSRADRLLPPELLHKAGLEGLRNSTAEAMAWRIPAYVPIDAYNEIFLPAGHKMIADVANEKISLDEATEQIERARSKLEFAE